VGLTLIQRSAGTRPPKNPKIALVLAGGAVTGGAFKVGRRSPTSSWSSGRSPTSTRTWASAGVSRHLARGGDHPDEMIRPSRGTSQRLDRLPPIDFYNPNIGEVIGRGAVFGARLAAYLPGLLLDLASVLPDLPTKLGPSLRRLLDEPSYTHLESFLMELYAEVSPKREFPPIGALLPSGLFDNAPLERWLAGNMAKLGVPNYFADFYRETGRKLYLTATNLDTAERVLFGPENDHGLTVSEAVQASSALPGFFKPARINGVDYVDGGVRKTANIDVAVEQGADLIICYNPFRPFLNDPHAPGRVGSRYLADRGLTTVLNQVLRTMLHTRLAMGLRAYMYDEHFRGDIVVIEARETDEKFFDLNPLEFWRRSDAVQHGLESVRETLLDSADVLQPIFSRYGLQFRAPQTPGRASAPAERESRATGPNLRVVSGNSPA
jgi:predicted acylesterase/phospholipase RssA